MAVITPELRFSLRESASTSHERDRGSEHPGETCHMIVFGVLVYPSSLRGE
ncbi:hypothetical protein SNOG_11294 [Parastagonospora nodorum SN15]|uniref:Uncharacterized protein n=1 Tax=Phaeosphaeria nodorum (strain SN15 / ATCC MYA-4574 / FGSC 10173) TaxID=321614 RepID=Q0UAC0_PHANO|nr:hypothetical protein SNOG_11294 [Parastagonospora nodorum SN15]EAT81002.1 hypothetical protein SNOG_11294 [Parastagonospora nodorum SN15]